MAFVRDAQRTFTKEEKRNGKESDTWPELPLVEWWGQWTMQDRRLKREGVEAPEGADLRALLNQKKHLTDRAVDAYLRKNRAECREVALAQNHRAKHRGRFFEQVIHSVANDLFKLLPKTSRPPNDEFNVFNVLGRDMARYL